MHVLNLTAIYLIAVESLSPNNSTHLSIYLSGHCSREILPAEACGHVYVFYCNYKDNKLKSALRKRKELRWKELSEWGRIEERRVKANQIRTKLQCSLCSTLLYSALPVRILNCLSAVSDLKEVGLFKSLISHCLSCSSVFFLSSKNECSAFFPRSTLSHVFLNLFFQMKSTRHREINEMSRRVKVFDGTPDAGKVLSS